jgi:diguanylate cyclase (GGDEF)-like protein/PAS domain S-box-containing protein
VSQGWVHRFDEAADDSYRALVEAAPDAFVTVDEHGAVVAWNPAAERLFGQPADETLGRPFEEVLPERPEAGCDRLGITRLLEEPTSAAVSGRVVELDAVGRGGTVFPVEVSVCPWEAHGRRYLTAIVRDLTEWRRTQDELMHRALHDPLTGLPNRTLILDRLEGALARAGRHTGIVVVLYLDLDGFKVVNDTWGHAAGDHVLAQVGQRLSAAVRPGDTVARMGGDEFVVVCEDVLEDAEAALIAERLREAFDEPFQLESQSMRLAVSIGVAIATDASPTPASLLRDADAGLYRTKARRADGVLGNE